MLRLCGLNKRDHDQWLRVGEKDQAQSRHFEKTHAMFLGSCVNSLDPQRSHEALFAPPVSVLILQSPLNPLSGYTYAVFCPAPAKLQRLWWRVFDASFKQQHASFRRAKRPVCVPESDADLKPFASSNIFALFSMAPAPTPQAGIQAYLSSRSHPVIIIGLVLLPGETVQTSHLHVARLYEITVHNLINLIML